MTKQSYERFCGIIANLSVMLQSPRYCFFSNSILQKLNSAFTVTSFYYKWGNIATLCIFGPALFVGGDALTNVWVFLVAPLVGGVFAALVYKFLDSKKAE